MFNSDIKTTQYIEQLSSSLFKFQQENLFCDIILVSGSTSISCHKIILAASCQYFKDRLLNNQDSLIYLPSWFDENILMLIIYFLYTGSIDQQLFTNISLLKKIIQFLGIDLNLQKNIPNQFLSINIKNETPLIEDVKIEKNNVMDNCIFDKSNTTNSLKYNKPKKLRKTKSIKTLSSQLKTKQNRQQIYKNEVNSYLISGDKYSCNLCDKSFRFNFGLNFHKQNTHPNHFIKRLYFKRSYNIFLNCINLKKYSCNICNKFFKYKSVCSSHIYKHHKINHYFSSLNNIYLGKHYETLNKNKLKYLRKQINRKSLLKLIKCVHCHKSFLNIKKLDIHIINTHGIALLKCNFCDFKTNFEEYLNRHSNKHTKVKSCSICGESFNLINKLISHQFVVHGIKDEALKTKLMKCPKEDCDYECISKKRFQDHALKHTDYKLFSCDMCEKQFKHQIGLKKHKQLIHDRVRPFICEVCGLCFGKDSELRFHIIRHSKEKRFKCEKCPYSTHDKCNLQSHMFRRHKIMTNPRMTIFKCNFCQFVTNCKGNYRDHMKKHTNVLDVPCTQCGKLFATKKNLYGHITKVHRPKSLHCSFCAYSTSLPTTLREHLRIMHEQRNVKPFECPLCGFRSAIRGNCRKHIQRLHNEYRTEPQQVVMHQTEDVLN